MSLKVLLTDKLPIFRQGLRALLLREPDMVVVAEAADGEETVRLARESSPDVVVLDVAIPGGMEAIARIADESLGHVLVLTATSGRQTVVEALGAGAAGYVMKNVPVTELTEAIRTVAAGRDYLQRSVSTLLLMDGKQRKPRS